MAKLGPKVRNFDFNTDLDTGIHSNADPDSDPASQHKDSDPASQHHTQ
jgi:hypothetical protein